MELPGTCWAPPSPAQPVLAGTNFRGFTGSSKSSELFETKGNGDQRTDCSCPALSGGISSLRKPTSIIPNRYSVWHVLQRARGHRSDKRRQSTGRMYQVKAILMQLQSSRPVREALNHGVFCRCLPLRGCLCYGRHRFRGARVLKASSSCDFWRALLEV